MFEIQAENRELTLAESINPKKPTKGLTTIQALTFGTLLSSQGTDAQQIPPHRGFIVGGLSTLHRAPGGPGGALPRPPWGGLARRREKTTCVSGRCQTTGGVTPDT